MYKQVARLWICLPFVVVGCLDAAVTLRGQGPIYWSGVHDTVREGFGLFAVALRHGPLAFGAAFAVWVLFFCGLMMMLPAPLAEVLALGLVNGHTWGTMTWLVYDLQVRYELALLFFAFTATLFVLCNHRWHSRCPANNGSKVG